MTGSAVIANVFKVVLLPLLLCLWAAVGFFLWVPLLLQGMSMFFGVHVRSSLYGGTVEHAGRVFDKILLLWPRGFASLVRGFLHEGAASPTTEEGVVIGGSWAQLLGQCLVSLVVWAALVLLLNLIAPQHVSVDGIIHWFGTLPERLRDRLHA